MSRPKISVVIVYKNVEDEVCNCISSILYQTFTNIELICVNNGSTDNSEKKVVNLTHSDERVINLKIIESVSYEEAAARGISISSGDYICVYNEKKILEADELEKKYIEAIKSEAEQLTLTSEKLFKRAYVDNKSCLKDLLKSFIEENNKEILDKLLATEKAIYSDIEKCYKYNIEHLNNNNYGIVLRCDALEKLIFSFEERLKKHEKENYKIFESYKDDINLAIQSISDSINHVSNEKGTEISKIYDDINKNYKYTEHIVKALKEEVNCLVEHEKYDICEKIDSTKNELQLKNDAFQKYVETAFDVVSSNVELLKQGTSSVEVTSNDNKLNVIDIEEYINKRFDELYKYINENNLKFYNELSNMYKEINEKLQSSRSKN